MHAQLRFRMMPCAGPTRAPHTPSISRTHEKNPTTVGTHTHWNTVTHTRRWAHAFAAAVDGRGFTGAAQTKALVPTQGPQHEHEGMRQGCSQQAVALMALHSMPAPVFASAYLPEPTNADLSGTTLGAKCQQSVDKSTTGALACGATTRRPRALRHCHMHDARMLPLTRPRSCRGRGRPAAPCSSSPRSTARSTAPTCHPTAHLLPFLVLLADSRITWAVARVGRGCGRRGRPSRAPRALWAACRRYHRRHPGPSAAAAPGSRRDGRREPARFHATDDRAGRCRKAKARKRRV